MMVACAAPDQKETPGPRGARSREALPLWLAGGTFDRSVNAKTAGSSSRSMMLHAMQVDFCAMAKNPNSCVGCGVCRVMGKKGSLQPNHSKRALARAAAPKLVDLVAESGLAPRQQSSSAEQRALATDARSIRGLAGLPGMANTKRETQHQQDMIL